MEIRKKIANQISREVNVKTQAELKQLKFALLVTLPPGGCKASTIKYHFLLGKMNYVYSLAAFGRFQGRENNLIGEITCHYMFCFIFCMTNQDY